MTEMSILIRVDAGTRMGSGHVMRCMALAQAAQQQGHSVMFLCHQMLPGALHQRLLTEGMQITLHDESLGSVADAQRTIQVYQQEQSCALVLDGYHFDTDYQRLLRKADIAFLMIDDNAHAEAYYSNWILNQNIHANEAMYTERESYTELLLGTRYALLRKEFWEWRGWQREIPEAAQHVLITMGGSDPDNVTQKVLESLKSMPSANAPTFRVVIGGSNPHRADLEAFTAQSDLSVELLHNVTDMPSLMAWADVAISAGGSTVWELCMMGVPTITIIVADNQRQLVHGLDTNDCVQNLGYYEAVSSESIFLTIHRLIDDHTFRKNLSDTMRQVVDGFGADRVFKILKQQRKQ